MKAGSRVEPGTSTKTPTTKLNAVLLEKAGSLRAGHLVRLLDDESFVACISVLLPAVTKQDDSPTGLDEHET